MRRLPVLLVLVALMLAVPSVACAAEAAAPTPGGTPVVPSVLDVQLWPQDVAAAMTLIVVAELPTDAPMPASVSIPLPEGSFVTWAGEIYEQQAQDIQRQPVTAPDGRSVTITSQGSRVIQYEAQYKPYVDRGGRRYAALEWVQTKPSDSTRFAFRLPTTSDDVKSKPPYVGTPEANGAGQKLYNVGEKKLAVGEKFTLEVDYTPGRVDQLPPVQKERPDLLLPVLVGLLVVVLGVIIALVLRNRSAGE